ncbi:MAG: right-handed parallel beta-helix repeat-containing protein [Elusimicrobia bacterium]|nr:right-handed parallel beta-helix repeat-containing protein [Elusimicrobiota bacterium]
MKKIASILFLSVALISCSKRFSGSISKNTVWKSHVKLTGDVVVEKRATLKILPGTKISYSRKPNRQIRYIREEAGGTFNILQNDRIEILVEGKLFAIGTAQKPIIFEERDTSGGIILLGKNPAKISFAKMDGCPVAIRIYGEGSPKISGCEIKNCDLAGIGYWDLAGGEIENSSFEICRHAIGIADFAKPLILNSKISFSKNAGIFCEGSAAPVVAFNTITGNNVGIAGGEISNATISENRIFGNGAGISLWTKAKAKIEKNKIEKNVSGVLLQEQSSAEITNNTLSANGSGVSCVNASQANINGNRFEKNNFSIIGRDSSQTRIARNIFRGGKAIKISEVSAAKITRNDFLNCETGITIMNKATVRIYKNTMENVKTKIKDTRVK